MTEFSKEENSDVSKDLYIEKLRKRISYLEQELVKKTNKYYELRNFKEHILEQFENFRDLVFDEIVEIKHEIDLGEERLEKL